jgi:hypothetical protein
VLDLANQAGANHTNSESGHPVFPSVDFLTASIMSISI